MKCPHCLEAFFEKWDTFHLEQDVEYIWNVQKTKCPTCNRFIIRLNRFKILTYPKEHAELLVYPKTISRNPLHPSVDKKFAEDYKDACLVLQDSPKASAALSRRCLQNLLREKANVKHSDLSKEIEEVILSGKLPTPLAESIDAVRNIGNFASHPIKNTNTGEIVEVESGEAEWLLDTLEGLFDYYFVQPAIIKDKKDKLNQKLAEAGKPPMK
jgi:hypothetical protein